MTLGRKINLTLYYWALHLFIIYPILEPSIFIRKQLNKLNKVLIPFLMSEIDSIHKKLYGMEINE